MKYIIVLFIASFFFLVNTSCRKCVTCSYTYPKDGLVGGLDTTIKYDEYCDKKKVLKTYEENIKHLADSLRGSSSCQ